ncbi:MAG: hypothetical protein RhofKO_26970 [Rhodothermales bacterium]
MFDLDRAITTWRAGFEKDPAFHPAEVNELEDHLRDSIHEEVEAGLPARRAFMVVTQRVGFAQTLRQEYLRSSVWKQPWVRVLRIATLVVLGVLLALKVAGIGHVRLGLGAPPYAWLYAQGAIMLFGNLAIFLAFAGLLLWRRPTRKSLALVGLSFTLIVGAIILPALLLLSVTLGWVNALTLFGLLCAATYARSRRGLQVLVMLGGLVLLAELWSIGQYAYAAGAENTFQISVIVLGRLVLAMGYGVLSWSIWQAWVRPVVQPLLVRRT